MLPCVCSVIDHRWRQSVVRTKHGIYLFYTIKKQTTTAFLVQNSKADLCPLRRTRKKPFDVICCQNENEAISLVAMCSKRIVIGPGKSCHRQLDLNGFLWNENLQRKQNWTAKSTNLKENAGKIKVVLQSEQSCEPKSLDDTLNAAGVERIHLKNSQLQSTLNAIRFEFWMKGVFSEGGNFCPLWFSNQFDKVLDTAYSCRGVGREL